MELTRVDALLDDPAFFAPFGRLQSTASRHLSTPMELYLRLMFLKFRYELCYDSLYREGRADHHRRLHWDALW